MAITNPTDVKLSYLAKAKINLDLLITGRRDDGFHELDSIVGFADFGDELSAENHNGLSLSVTGPFADHLDSNDHNLIIEAAKLICEAAKIKPNVKFHLIKNLPVSSGIGGGSADAAAALKLCQKIFDLDFSDDELASIALKLGADVPVCLKSTPHHMTGIGEKLSPLLLKDKINLVLVNPGKTLSTPNVFQAYKKFSRGFDQKRSFLTTEIHLSFIIETLQQSGNSLQSAACEIEPEIDTVMSGSGATCFGLYKNKVDCQKASELIFKQNPTWWVKSVEIN
jgi:4-diphosphocytidyl-2-C-methyl-D-erythritol kinase